MPKGGLIADHVLIIPIEHAPSTLALSASARAEMERYRDALAAYEPHPSTPSRWLTRAPAPALSAALPSRGRSSSCGSATSRRAAGGICTGRSSPSPTTRVRGRWPPEDQHAARPSLSPPPRSTSAAAEAKETFAAAFKRLGVPVEEESAATPLVEAVGDSKGHYINLELPCGTRLLHRIQPEERRRYHIQFVREIAASLLGMPERADWKVCAMDTAGETQVANRFKNLFKPFDWNLQQ